MVSKGKILEIISFYLDKGKEETLTAYSLSEETFNRYYREYKKQFGSSIDLYSQLKERFTVDELKAIASGTRKETDSRTQVINFDCEEIVFGALTDSHIGSKYTDESYIVSALEEFEKQNCSFFIHAGDVTEGMSGRDGHTYELTHIGYKAQKEASVRLFSKWKKPAYYLSGNHDLWYMNKANIGADIVEDITQNIPNAVYLGQHEGDLIINGVTLKLWHGEDTGCFDNQTEILTNKGWKYFTDLSKSDMVATMTKEDHEFQWQYPLTITNEPYIGKMVHFNSRTVDCMVTPNHGMWTRASDAATYRRKTDLAMPTKSHIRLNTDWHRKNAEDIISDYARQKWQFTKACNTWNGNTPDTVFVPPRKSKNTGKKVHHYGNLDIEDAVELIAWYVTEGHACNGKVSISQYQTVNPSNHDQIIRLAERIGGSFGYCNKSISFYSMELAEWLKNECGHGSKNKYLPQWLKDCTTDILELVLATMIKGDGWNVNSKALGYRSISGRLLQDISEIAIKCGYSVRYNSDGETIGISKAQVMPTVNALPKLVDYNGTIHCCEVPNGLILVRRNGCILWTHNSYATSYRIQKLIESLNEKELPDALFCGHTHKQGYFFERNIQAVTLGSIQKQSAWMRRKRLPAHCGFYIIKMGVKNNKIIWFEPRFYPFY